MVGLGRPGPAKVPPPTVNVHLIARGRVAMLAEGTRACRQCATGLPPASSFALIVCIAVARGEVGEPVALPLCSACAPTAAAARRLGRGMARERWPTPWSIVLAAEVDR